MNPDRRSLRFVGRMLDALLAQLDEIIHGSDNEFLRRARANMREAKYNIVSYLENNAAGSIQEDKDAQKG